MRYITFCVGIKRRKLDEYRSLITTLIVLGVIVAGGLTAALH
ncbi:hypothetical protein [Salmonella enterica]